MSFNFFKFSDVEGYIQVSRDLSVRFYLMKLFILEKSKEMAHL